MVQTKEQAILGIYSECDRPTATRIRKLAQAVYGVDVTNAEIIEIVEGGGHGQIERVAIERKGIDKDYPDIWAIFNETVTAYKLLRRIWGEEIADRFAISVRTFDEISIWDWREELLAATTSIEKRKAINWGNPSGGDCELAAKFEPDSVRRVISQAIARQRSQDETIYKGAEWPVIAPGYWEAKEAKFQSDCLEKAWSEQEAIDYFARFWGEVRANRGDRYVDELRRGLAGFNGASGHHTKGFYEATELQFRHFLFNLRGFKTKGPHRVVLTDQCRSIAENARLPMALEGTLIKHGWVRVRSFVIFGLLCGGPAIE